MRADKAKNIAKVAKVVLQEPLLTRDEIAEKAGVGTGTASIALSELKNNGRLEEALRKYEEQQKILCDDFKKEIDNELLSQFITLTGSKVEATKQIEDFLRLTIEGTKRRRKGISDNTRYGILHKSGFKCQACGVSPKPDNDIELEIDHIIPFTQGGICIEGNYQVLCKSCNASKGNEFIFNHNLCE